MKRSDVITIVLVAAIGLIASYFGLNLMLGDPNEFEVTYKDIEPISADLAAVDDNTFNPSAINPTVEVYVGDCLDEDGDGVISASERATCTTGVSSEDTAAAESETTDTEQTDAEDETTDSTDAATDESQSAASGGSVNNGTANSE